LLSSVGIQFEVIPGSVIEVQLEGEKPETFVLRMAEEKAKQVAERYPDRVVLAADTVVVVDGKILGKPTDMADASRMLALLQGRGHSVLTAYSIVDPSKDGSVTRVVETLVRFRQLAPSEISAYAESGEALDKAGAYAIQGGAAAFVQSTEGSYTNVVGLPLAELEEDLKALGLWGAR
jgi:septum formation protein